MSGGCGKRVVRASTGVRRMKMDIIREKWEEILYTVKMEHELSDIS